MKISCCYQLIVALLIFCYLFSKTHVCFAADTISGNQSLSGDQTLISKGGVFELGFFQPGNSSKYYIGIWYKKIPGKTVVWVANRETPVPNKYNSHLTIQDNNLVLQNESQIPIWSTNLKSTTSSPNPLIATLSDEGNLVLSDVSNSTIRLPIWQSFDYPTDTWLPGGKLSYSKITGTKQLLTSWNNSEDPSPGLFSIELDATQKSYIIRWDRSIQYWTSGPWNGRIFSQVPEMTLNYFYNFSYVDNVNESYFTYTVYDPSIITRFVMDVSGQVKQLTWLDNSKEWNLFWTQPRQQCSVYAYCGAFGVCNEKSLPFCNCLPGFKHMSDVNWNLNDFSGGCVTESPMQCELKSSTNVQKDKFMVQYQMSLPNDSRSLNVGSTGECASSCLSNCSCSAYAFDSSSGCSIFSGEVLNLQQLSADDGSGKSINIRVAASEVSSGKSNTWISIVAVLASVAVVLAIFGLLFIVIYRRKRRVGGTGNNVEGSLVAFRYKDLQSATKGFSEKLGGGGFGFVYKGILTDSSVIAVKKLESISQGEKQFRTEVSTIGTIQHVNLVRLRGFCSKGNNRLLVYDYMSNSSLDTHLFKDNDSKVIDWKTRYQLALGTARGLHYLHEKCRDCIIHCDIKPENILLDAEFCPKVADFGLAKLMGRDFSRVLTTMRGTRGYLAPEWISGVAITPKADVYSYGMMLFEIISGSRNSEHSVDGVVKFFPTWAAKVVVEEEDILTILDHKLDQMADAEEVSRLARLACWCIQDDENHRPTMGQVVQILEGVLEVNLPPVPRSLQVFVDNDNNDRIVYFTESSSSKQTSLMQTNISTDSSNTETSMDVPNKSSDLGNLGVKNPTLDLNDRAILIAPE